MLQKIRDRISGWIAGVIIALVAGAFILFGVEYYFGQSASDQNDAATVNGVAITHDQVSNAFSQLQKQTMSQMQGHPLTDAMTQELKNYALQSLVTQTALFTSFEKEGFVVGLPQVKMMIEQAPEFQDNGKFSEAKLMQTLYQANLTPMQFFNQVQSQWIVNQVTSGISTAAFALPNEVKQVYALMHQKRAFGYVIIPAKKFESTVNVSDADIKNNYTLNQSIYETPAKVSVSYILLSPTDLAKKITVTTEDAKAYYESHAQNFSKSQSFASAEKKLIALIQHQRVSALLTKESSALADLTYTNPDSLDVAAKTLNLPIQTSPMLTKTGEKTGIFANPKVLEAIFSDSVFKSNNNSNPIDLSDGSQIVLRIEKKIPSQPIPLTTVSAQIKEKLIEKEAQAQAGLLAYQMQKKIAGGANPETVAKQNQLQWQMVPLASRTEKSTAPEAIQAAAFNAAGSQAVLFDKHDYAVIDVSKMQNADPSQSSATDTKQLSQQLSALWGQLIQHCFVNSVIAGSHIKLTA